MLSWVCFVFEGLHLSPVANNVDVRYWGSAALLSLELAWQGERLA
ncbi:hypothetical protein ACSTLX_24520 [Vibrio parahaemolyticus]|nr:hypothetical protein [Vibrio parahaemolyticus]